jgi:beta-lactam-binding protein with PASTA domain
VPDLAGAGGGDVKSAVQRLAEGGLRASVQCVPGTAPIGTVTAQFPKPGATATSGAHVTLSVSSGPGQKPAHPPEPTTPTRALRVPNRRYDSAVSPTLITAAGRGRSSVSRRQTTAFRVPLLG